MPAMILPTLMRGAAAIGLALALIGCRMDAPDSPTPPHASAAAEQVVIGDISWYVDMDAARAVARSTGKALWVHFGENPG